ncbi:cupin domain-containing protein [Psychromonas antarctica]|uniref:cupin domain-containing protein n=1 Tax=Psychromonas antarctica TaxID=67573 RepID=UPI001EE8ED51|nr:cupin domain-containing protein [Psychromonas antarctica]MCG6200633.1 cupin domain-containing protein [Psychromonas antarctica]
MKEMNSFWQQLYAQSQQVDLDNMPVEHMQLNHDLAVDAAISLRQSPWLPSPAKGIKRLLLEREGGEKTLRATSIVAYQPNSQFASHTHPMGEEFFVLAGTFSDQYGDYPTGSYVRNPPGSSHKPFSRDGCLIWVKLQQFAPNDSQHVVLSSGQQAANIDDRLCNRRILFNDYEKVELLKANQDFVIDPAWSKQGIEILVLQGQISSHKSQFNDGHWLRLAASNSRVLTVKKSSQLLIKYQHLEL